MRLVYAAVIGTLLGLGGAALYELYSAGSTAKADQITSVTTLPDRIEFRVTPTGALAPRVSPPEVADGPHSTWHYSDTYTLPQDVVVSGFTVEIENGSPDMLHHARVILPERPAVVCSHNTDGDSEVYEIYAASRNTADPMLLPAPYGLFLAAGEQLQLEFMEHTRAHPHSVHHDHSDVTPTLNITMLLDDSRVTPVEFARVRLDDSPCEQPARHQAFTVATSTLPLTITSQSGDPSAVYRFAESGTIVLAGANFWPQKGGQQLVALRNGEPVHTFMSDPAPEPWQQNIPHTTEPVSFKAGQLLTISATYANPFDTPVTDASGMYGFYFTQK